MIVVSERGTRMMNYGGMNAGWAIFWMVAVVAIIALVVWAILRAGNQRG